VECIRSPLLHLFYFRETILLLLSQLGTKVQNFDKFSLSSSSENWKTTAVEAAYYLSFEWSHYVSSTDSKGTKHYLLQHTIPTEWYCLIAFSWMVTLHYFIHRFKRHNYPLQHKIPERKVLLNCFHLYGHTLGFYQQGLKLQPPCLAQWALPGKVLMFEPGHT